MNDDTPCPVVGPFYAHPQRAQHDRDWHNMRAWFVADFRRYGVHPAASRSNWDARNNAKRRRERVLALREDWYWIHVGTPVTWITAGGAIACSVVDSIRNDRAECTTAGGARLHLRDEGRVWIRGHHPAGTEQGDALLVGAVLWAA